MFRTVPTAVLRRILLAACLCASLVAQVHLREAAAPAQTEAPVGPTDPAELEHFIDGVIAAQKEALGIEGMTISVVAKGRLFFAKGYGYADRTKGTRVDPERTLFRVGSVSKLFTWTAVMQLVEQGRLDLKADVNTYLAGSPVRVPEAFGQPITLAHLLSHTPGFEDRLIGLFRRSVSDLRPLGEELASGMPARVRPPGQHISYSNYGAALAGYIVERVSGMPFERYVEERILNPLRMEHATFRQPVPEALKVDLAVGYRYSGRQHSAQPFELLSTAPDGALSASAVDMSRFMLAHLNNGALGDARILAEPTARLMHSRLFTHRPDFNGMLHGFYEMDQNGHRIYGHGGATICFHTDLALFPEANVGLFMSYNSDVGLPARQALLKAFIDRYFPGQVAQPTCTRTEPAGTLAGSYHTLRRSYATIERIGEILGCVQVKELPDGGLWILGLPGASPHWVPESPGVFRAKEGTERIAFLKDASGRATHFIRNDNPTRDYERIGYPDSPSFHRLWMGGSFLVILIGGLAWPVSAWRRRNTCTPEASRAWGRLGAWLAAVILLGVSLVIGNALAGSVELLFGLPSWLRGVLLLPWIATALVAMALGFLVRAWWKKQGSLAGRLFDTALVSAEMAFLAALRHWNLLG